MALLVTITGDAFPTSATTKSVPMGPSVLLVTRVLIARAKYARTKSACPKRRMALLVPPVSNAFQTSVTTKSVLMVLTGLHVSRIVIARAISV